MYYTGTDICTWPECAYKHDTWHAYTIDEERKNSNQQNYSSCQKVNRILSLLVTIKMLLASSFAKYIAPKFFQYLMTVRSTSHAICSSCDVQK